MSKSVVIIGGGIAGLSCGCYAAMNGYQATILEMHAQPGGVCTAWKRKGYTLDGCLHWLMGSSPSSGMNKLWRELGVAQGRRFIDAVEYRRYEEDGRSLSLYTDLERLQAHLLEVAPEDEALIRELTRAIGKMGAIEMPIDPPWSWRGLKPYIGMLPVISVFRRFSRMSLSELCARMKSPFLRRAFEALFPIPEGPASGILMGLAAQTKKNAGYPVGGSLAFAQAMAKRFASLCGQIVYGARATEIIVEKGRAVAVRTEDGREYRGDHVVSAADGRTTLYTLLGGKFLDARLRSFYEGGMATFPPLVQVSLGLRRPIEGPSGIAFRLSSPVEIGAKKHVQLTVRNMAEDPELAPPGCSVVTVTLESDYDYWADLHRDQARYDAEKARIGADVVARLDVKWPGFAADVEVLDVATPLTWERYTGNWRGAYEGWMVTTKTMEQVMGPGLPKKLPGLDGFSMIGQWTTFGGGVPPAAKDGRDLIRKLCRADGRRFITTEA